MKKEMIDVISIDLNGKETKEKWDYRDVYCGNNRLYEAERLLREINLSNKSVSLIQKIKDHFNKWEKKSGE